MVAATVYLIPPNKRFIWKLNSLTGVDQNFSTPFLSVGCARMGLVVSVVITRDVVYLARESVDLELGRGVGAPKSAVWTERL